MCFVVCYLFSDTLVFVIVGGVIFPIATQKMFDHIGFKKTNFILGSVSIALLVFPVLTLSQRYFCSCRLLRIVAGCGLLWIVADCCGLLRIVRMVVDCCGWLWIVADCCELLYWCVLWYL
jgi:LacY proton/sugar symporter